MTECLTKRRDRSKVPYKSIFWGYMGNSGVYDLKKKWLPLHEKGNHFYASNNAFVAGTGLEPVTFGL